MASLSMRTFWDTDRAHAWLERTAALTQTLSYAAAAGAMASGLSSFWVPGTLALIGMGTGASTHLSLREQSMLYRQALEGGSRIQYLRNPRAFVRADVDVGTAVNEENGYTYLNGVTLDWRAHERSFAADFQDMTIVATSPLEGRIDLLLEPEFRAGARRVERYWSE